MSLKRSAASRRHGGNGHLRAERVGERKIVFFTISAAFHPFRAYAPPRTAYCTRASLHLCSVCAQIVHLSLRFLRFCFRQPDLSFRRRARASRGTASRFAHFSPCIFRGAGFLCCICTEQIVMNTTPSSAGAGTPGNGVLRGFFGPLRPDSATSRTLNSKSGGWGGAGWATRVNK